MRDIREVVTLLGSRIRRGVGPQFPSLHPSVERCVKYVAGDQPASLPTETPRSSRGAQLISIFQSQGPRVGKVGRRANRCLSAPQCRHRPPAPQYLLFATRLSLLPRHNSLPYSFPTYRTLLWTLFIIPILLLAPSYELPNLDCQERVP